MLYFSIDYKFEFAKTFNLTVSNIIIAIVLIVFYKEQKILLLIDRNRYISLSYAKDFCINKLISLDYKFYKKQTTIKETILYI